VTARAAGAFIALEGGEGAGKSTQGGLLVKMIVLLKTLKAFIFQDLKLILII